MPREPDLRLLRYFLAVADELHFGRAAARLFIAQPSLSQQIRRLEADLGLVLFQRNRRGVALTPAGQALVTPARRAVAAADQFAARAGRLREHRTDADRLVLGFQIRLPGDALTRLVRAHRQNHPGVQVDLRQYDFTDTSCGLVGGTADAAILSLPVVHDLHVEELYREPVVALLPAGLPLARQAEVTVADMIATGLPWAQPLPPDPVWRDFWTAAAQRAQFGARGQVATESPPNVESYLLAVAAGQVIGLTSAGVARANAVDGVAAVPVRGLPAARFAIARRADDTRSGVAQLIASARALWPAETSPGDD